MKELNGGHSTIHISDTYVDVFLPLGKANCSFRDSTYSSHYMYYEVNCLATVGSDNKGFLVCYQNFYKALPNGDVTRSTEFIWASFWMLKDSPVFCCSFRGHEEIDQDSCTDFIYHPADIHHEATSVKPSETIINYIPFTTPTPLSRDETASMNNANLSEPILTKIQKNIMLPFGLVVFLVTTMIIILIFVALMFISYMIRLSIIPYKACKRVVAEDLEENNDGSDEGNVAAKRQEMQAFLENETNDNYGNASEAETLEV